MAVDQRKEVVIESRPCPLEGIDRMADRTILGKSRFSMIRVGGTHIVFTMTIYAIYSQDIKPDHVFRFVAGIAIGSPVSSEKREPASLVNLSYIAHQP
jgi:hypothetical protein